MSAPIIDQGLVIEQRRKTVYITKLMHGYVDFSWSSALTLNHNTQIYRKLNFICGVKYLTLESAIIKY